MRVSIVTETYPPEVNGVARTVRSFARGLATQGHQVQLVRPRLPREVRFHDRDLEQLLVAGWPIPLYRELRFGSYSSRRLTQAWRAHRPDVVHVATEGPLGLAASVAARRLEIPWTATFHTRFDRYSAHYRLGFAREAIARYLRWFHNRAETTFVPTSQLAESLRAAGFERLSILGRGVDLSLFHPLRRSTSRRARWGGDARTPIVLYVGRLAREKNIDLAVEAFRRIQQQRPDAKMVLVGSGPERRRLQSEGSDLVFPGVLRGADLAQAYASADLFLFPSLTETFGNVVPEAMASGVAVHAFHDAAAGELISCGEDGVTVEPGDAEGYLRIAGSLGRLPLAIWRNLGRRARARVEGRDWARVAGDFADRLARIADRAVLPEAA